MELFTFQARDQILGIDAQYVYRVVDDISIAPAPLSPACHLGLLYYRGELFDVIDIASLLGQGKADVAGNFRIILVRWSGKKFALVPDRIIGLLCIEDKEKGQTVCAKENHVVRPITPDQIWNELLKLRYGPKKISEDLHSRVG
jgi:chemotaxis signal transduction protein